MTDQKKQPVSEVSKMLNTAVTGIAGMVGDMKSQINSRIEQYLSNLDLVKREEVEVLKEMLSEIRKEQSSIKKRLDALEKKK